MALGVWELKDAQEAVFRLRGFVAALVQRRHRLLAEAQTLVLHRAMLAVR